ncbi:MAG: GAF domain-containing protein [Armatimonas sp.]
MADREFGEMAELVRGFDWSVTPLGPMESWPQSLKTAVQMVLAMPFPNIVLWGPELIQIYNNGYRDLMGSKHPGGLGQSNQVCWPEVWHINEPIYKRVFAGESVSFEDTLYPLAREGTVEEVWLTLSYSPIHNEAGEVAGVLVNVFETTQRKQAEMALEQATGILRSSEQWQRFLLNLNDRLRPLTDAEEVLYEAARTLGEYLGASRVGYAEDQGDDVHVAVTRNYTSGVPGIEGVYTYLDYGPELVTQMRAGRTVVYSDIAQNPALSPAEKEAHAVLQLGATVNIPLIKGGRLVAILFVHQTESRAWTTDEIHLMEETAQRTWAAVERARAELALQDSEERYRTIFNSINEGFSLLDIQFDENGQAYDVIIRDANPAQDRIDGVRAMIGKRVREILPNIELKWIERYGDIARSGEAAHFEDWSEANQRWYDVNASRVGGAGSTLVAIVYSDITERKRADALLEFSLKLSDALRPLADPIQIQIEAMRILGEHLGVLRAQYWEVDSDPEYLVTAEGYGNGVEPQSVRVRMDDFGVYVKEAFRAGQTLAVADVQADSRVSEAESEAYGWLGLRAFIAVPLVKDGRFVACIGLHHATPRQWTADDVAMTEETAQRTWEAVERAHAEAALAASEEQYRTLFTSMDDGFCTIEVLFDGQGNVTDYRFLEANPAFVRQTGLENATGSLMRELVPEHEEFWFTTYGHIARTGEPLRFEHQAAALNRFFDVYAFRIGEPGQNRVAVLFNDFSERKRLEANLAILAEVSQDLLHLDNIEEAMDRLGAKIGAYFGVQQCLSAEYVDEFKTAIVSYGWHADNAPDLKGAYRLRDFLSEEALEAHRTGKPLIVSDTQSDPRVSAKSYSTLGIRSFIIIPLVRDGTWHFQMSIVDNRPRMWRPDEIELLTELTARIWVRLERARAELAVARANEELEQRVQERTEQLSSANTIRGELLHRLVNAQEEERGHIARELHDNTGQLVTALSLSLSNLSGTLPALLPAETTKLLTQMSQIVEDLSGEARRLAISLRPTALDQFGLMAALKNYLEQWVIWSGLPVDYQPVGFEGADGELRLPREVESAAYRVVQEALTNILRHASPNSTRQTGKRRKANSATRVSLLVQRTPTHLLAIVEDDGPGFDVGAAMSLPADRRRLGLFGMKERTELIGGTLEIESSSRAGTTIIFRAPL